MEYGIALVSIVPLREEQSEKSQQTTQLLFGETFYIPERNPKWARVRATLDEYEGWADPKLLTLLPEAKFLQVLDSNPYIVDSPIAYVEHEDGTFPVSLGSSLPFFDPETMELNLGGTMHYTLKGLFREADQVGRASLISKQAHKLLGAPYLWGGRGILGVDCSGFIQLVFKLAGIVLPRDSPQQAETGRTLMDFQEARAGDLAFFTNKNGRIAHVGIVLPDNEIIHAYGQVRVDKLTPAGIVQAKTGKQTHSLSKIQRIIQQT